FTGNVSRTSPFATRSCMERGRHSHASGRASRIAAGVRAYFLQPFKIPTGSMQPTLFGIVGIPTASPPPNPLTRAVHLGWLGRNYIDVTAKEDDILLDLQEAT
ncbi:MAG: hypothetical protein WBW78_20210, partial [Terrimicrobiaceae bacterium]